MSNIKVQDKVAHMANECLLVRLRTLVRVINAQFEERCRPHGIRASQLGVLGAVALEGKMTSHRLGELLHMNPSTVSRAVNRLQDKGWLMTMPSGEGKILCIEITAKGLHKIDAMYEDWQEAQNQCVKLLGRQAAEVIKGLGNDQLPFKE